MSEGKTGIDDFIDGKGAEAVEGLATEAPKIRPEYRLDPGKGVFWLPVDKDGNPLDPVWLCSPLEIVALTRDTTGHNWGYLLRFIDPDGTKKLHTLPAELLKGSGEDMRGILLSMGVRITTSKAKSQLGAYLQTHPPTHKERVTCTDRSGWHGSSFVLPHTTIGKDAVLFQSPTAGAKHPYEIKGAVTGWRDGLAALCVGNSRLTFSVSVSFAGPLLAITHTESGGFHWRGDSSTGKSTGLDAAAATWGNPDTFRQSWRGTDNGLEGIAAQHSETCLPIDEMGQVDPGKAGEVAYMLANEQGKGRAGRDGAARARHHWKVLFLSSGELSLTDHMAAAGRVSKAGQQLRLADIPADAGAGLGMFENLHGYPDGATFADAVKKAARTHYGGAGIAFLEKLVEEGRDRLAGRIEEHRQTFEAAYLPRTATGQIRRLARRFSLVAAAGELATGYGLTGWPDGEATRGAGRCFLDWLDSWGHGPKEDDTLIRQVKAFIEAHGASRFTTMRNTLTSDTPEEIEQRTIQRAGFREEIGGEVHYYVLPEAFREIVKGFDSKRAAATLAARGILRGSGGKTSTSKNLPGMGEKKRCYHLTPALWSDEEHPDTPDAEPEYSEADFDFQEAA